MWPLARGGSTFLYVSSIYFLIVLLQTFNLVLHALSPSDSCPVWLNQVLICALPIAASRHNSPAQPHVLAKLVSANLPAGDAVIVVINNSFVQILDPHSDTVQRTLNQSLGVAHVHVLFVKSGITQQTSCISVHLYF